MLFLLVVWSIVALLRSDRGTLLVEVDQPGAMVEVQDADGLVIVRGVTDTEPLTFSIPPGEFDMGSTEEEVARLLEEARATNQPSWYLDRLPSEAPRHRVRITKPFWLGRHELTRGHFRRFVEDGGYQTEAERDLGFDQADNHPVVNVSWNDVTAFCQWLSEKEGETYHLPSEAQWEYACRAGSTEHWCFGDDESLLEQYAWYDVNSGGKTHPVGQKKPNGWGLYDMHGNVWEWCADWFAGDYHQQFAGQVAVDPTGPTKGSLRVFRGGVWDSGASICRASYRHWDGPGDRYVNLGFRLLRVS